MTVEELLLNTLQKLLAALFLLLIIVVLAALLLKKLYLDETKGYGYKKKCIISVRRGLNGGISQMARVSMAVSELRALCSEETVVLNVGFLINPEEIHGLENEDIKKLFSLFLKKSNYDCTVLSPGDFIVGENILRDIVSSSDMGILTDNMDRFENLSYDGEKHKKCREIAAISSVRDFQPMPEAFFSDSFFEKSLSRDRVSHVRSEKSLVFIQNPVEDYFEVFAGMHMKNEFNIFLYEMYPEADAVVFFNADDIPSKKIDPSVKYIAQPLGSVMLMKIKKLYDKNGKTIKTDVRHNIFFLSDFYPDEEIMKARKYENLSKKHDTFVTDGFVGKLIEL